MVYFAFGLLAAFSSSAVAAFGFAAGAMPDPALAICLAAALVSEKNRDLSLAVVVGLAAGLFSATPWGLKPLVFLLAVGVTGLARRGARLDQGLSRFVMATTAAGLAGGLECLFAQAEVGFLRGVGDLCLRSLGTAGLTLVVLRVFENGRLLRSI